MGSWIFTWVILHMSWIVTVAILIIGVYAGLKYKKLFKDPLKKRKDEINELKERIDGINNDLSQWNREEEKNNFNIKNMEESFQKDPLLGSMWNQYKRSLIRRTSSDNTTTYYSSVDASEIFNVSELTRGLSFNFWKNLAGIYTGLGILGTFIGLTVGLLNIDMSTNAGLQSGISNMLGGTSAAFITSIFGISVAILFNYRFNCKTMKNFNQAVDELCESIDNMFDRRSIEDILYEQLEESRVQTASLKSLSADLGQVINETLEDVQDALDKSIESNFKPLFDELLESIKALNSGGMAALTESFNEGAGKQITSFAQTLRELEEGMKTILADSRSANEMSIKQLQQSIEELTQKMNDTISSSVDANTKGMNQNQEALTQIIQKVDATLNKAVLEMTTASEKSHAQFMDTMTNSAENVQSMVQALDTGFENQAQSFVDASEKMKMTLEESLTLIQDKVQKHEDATAQILSEIMTILNSSKGLVESAGTTAEQFSQAARPMQDVAHEINGQLNKVIDATSRFNQHVEKHSALFHDSITKNVSAMEKIEHSVSKMEASWKAYEEKFGIVNQGLENTFKVLLDNIRQYNDLTSNGLKENLNAFDTHIAAALNGIRGFNEELQEAVEDLNSAVTELNKTVTKSNHTAANSFKR